MTEILGVTAVGLIIPIIGFNLLTSTCSYFASSSKNNYKDGNADDSNRKKKRRKKNKNTGINRKTRSLRSLAIQAIILSLLCSLFVYLASKIEQDNEFFDPFEILGVDESSSGKYKDRWKLFM